MGNYFEETGGSYEEQRAADARDEAQANAAYKRGLLRTAANELMNIVNDTMDTPKELVRELATNHRTVQQGLTRIMVEWIEHLAALKDHEYDGRNEASVMLAKAIVATPEWESRKYLPHI